MGLATFVVFICSLLFLSCIYLANLTCKQTNTRRQGHTLCNSGVRLLGLLHMTTTMPHTMDRHKLWQPSSSIYS